MKKFIKNKINIHQNTHGTESEAIRIREEKNKSLQRNLSMMVIFIEL